MPKKAPPTYVYPDEAPVARIARYGGNLVAGLNGALVELGLYLPDLNKFAEPYFECHLTQAVQEGRKLYQVGEIILASVDEVVPLNETARVYIENATSVDRPVYSDEVYDLRDYLDSIDICVKADSVSVWTPAQRERVLAYVLAVRAAKIDPQNPAPVKPKELP